jgi:hypothetical protein
MKLKNLYLTSASLQLLFILSCGPSVKPSDTPNNQTSLEEIRKEPKIKEAIITDSNILYVSVEDDGTKRDGYAEYLCGILKDHKATTNWVKIVKVNSSKDPNKDNAYGILLGEALCE